MRKKKMMNTGTANSRHVKTGTSDAGGNARKSDHMTARDAQGVGKGTANSRAVSTMPSSSSGTIGKAQPLQTAKAVREQQNSTQPKSYGKVWRSTKPNK